MATLDTKLINFGVTSDLVIKKVTKNTTTAYTTEAGTSITGVKSVDATVKKTDKDLMAGFDLLAKRTIKQGYDIKFVTGVSDLTAMSIINGSTLTTGASSNTLVDKSTDVTGTFKLEFCTDMVEGGDAKDTHIVFPAVDGIISLSPKKDDFWELSFDGSAVLKNLDKTYSTIVQNAVATPIVLTAESETASS